MIRYFPEPYPDESIQSICIRYARRYGYDSYMDVLRGMYGKDYATRRINPLFGLDISRLVDNLPKDYYYNADDFINKHTAAPFYKIFMDEEKYKSFIDSIKYDSRNVGNIIKCNTNRLYFCRKCMIEDKKYYGESYLHRQHQIPGNLVCSKHYDVLEEVCIPTKYKIIDIDGIKIVENKINNWTPKEIAIGYKVAIGVDEILKQSNYIENRDSIIRIYKDRLIQLGYGGYKGFDRIRIVDEIYNWGEREFFKKINWDSIIYKKTRIVERFYGDGEYVIDPIKHIIFMYSMFGEVLDLSEIYKGGIREQDIDMKRKEIKKNKNRAVLLKAMEDEPGLKRTEIWSKYTSICSWTYEHDREWFNKNMPYALSTNGKVVNDLDEKKKYYREEFLHFLKKNPKIKRTSIIKEMNRAYTWLLKNDEGWLKEHLPPTCKFTIKGSSIEEIKERYRKKVLEVVVKYPTLKRSKLRDKARLAYTWLKENDIEWLDKNWPGGVQRYKY